MSKIYTSVDQLIGGTPLLELCNLEKRLGLRAKVLAKLEYLNPAGSAKDRIGLAMINAAEREGKLRPGSVIIEPTSGNTGIGLASVAAARGYRVIIVMPETSWPPPFPAASFPASLSIPSTPRRTIRPPAPKSGVTPTARLTSSSRVSAPAAPSPARGAI